MRSPFVLRSTHEQIVALHQAHTQRAWQRAESEHALATDLRQQLAEAQREIVALATQLAAKPAVAPTVVADSPFGPKTRAAIARQELGMPRLQKRAMIARARELVAMGMDDEHVAMAVHGGETWVQQITQEQA